MTVPAKASAARKGAVASGENGGAEEHVREATMDAVLTASGELGYRQIAVRTILEYSGGHRVQFYEHFKSKEDCFAQAYATWIDRLCVSLLEAAATVSGWEAGVRAAILRLFRFATDRPALTRALLVEGQIAGQPALARYEATLERLAAAIDSARVDLPPDEAPPEETGTFVVGGIASCVSEALGDGDPGRLWDALPELMHFAVGAYFDGEAAEGAFERASELLAREHERWTGGSE